MTRWSDAKRRLALYGGAGVFAVLVLWGAPAVVSRLAAPISVRKTYLEADAAMKTEAVKLLVEYVRFDTTNPPAITRPRSTFSPGSSRARGSP